MFDYLLVGGGLQNGLIALALLSSRPGARVALVERGHSIGGNHLWSFHAGDVPDDARALVDPLVAHRWPGYDVIFPGSRRALDEAYAAIPSSRLDAAVRDRLGSAPGCALFLGTSVTEVAPHRVTLADGRRLEAHLVIDARGPSALPADLAAGYQKFLGLELRVDPGTCPHRAVLMDASVPQRDGLRFFYVLPLSADRVLVEETYFSDTPCFDPEQVRPSVLTYALERGLTPLEIVREETGVLPLPWRLQPPPPTPGLLIAGYQGGWFHPTTGYSLPCALRLARVVASHSPSDLPTSAELEALCAARDEQLSFCLLLNRALFTAFAPEARVHAMERFYESPSATIRRFYAMTFTLADRLRLVWGRPPRGLSLRRAFEIYRHADGRAQASTPFLGTDHSSVPCVPHPRKR